jgi:hypothetical protein
MTFGYRLIISSFSIIAMSFTIALLITYVGFGLVYYAGSIVGLIKLMKDDNVNVSDLKSFRKQYQGAMGVFWKILGYIFMPILFMIYIIFIISLMIATLFRR